MCQCMVAGPLSCWLLSLLQSVHLWGGLHRKVRGKPPISKYRYASSGDFSLEKINDFGILIRCENMESKRYQNDNEIKIPFCGGNRYGYGDGTAFSVCIRGVCS